MLPDEVRVPQATIFRIVDGISKDPRTSSLAHSFLTKSIFLSNMSHELPRPLHAVLGFAQLIETGTPPPTPRKRTSAHSANGLFVVINVLLDWSIRPPLRLFRFAALMVASSTVVKM
jgi:signal transduction histidine kinase